MSILVIAYYRLLADISVLSGVSLDAPDEITDAWLFHEGPLLDKAILRYLEEGGNPPLLPQWLLPLWEAFLRSNEARFLGYTRQVLVFCYKAEFEPTNEQLKSAQSSFEENDTNVDIWNCAFNSTLPKHHIRTARQIVTACVREIARKRKLADIIPHHGPGSVFPARKPWMKSRFQTLYSPIQAYYPFDQFFCGIHTYWWDVMVDGQAAIREEDEIIASLTAVPKDSRGPRLICVHPAEAIWIQQGQRSVLEAAIDQFPLTRGKINFTDQTVNGQLALSSSKTRELVTLDLKDASDRMSAELVRFLFGETVYGWLSCSRATKIKLLDGRVVPLRKWAPMGNALTFPVQSLVFWALVRASIISRYGVNCDQIYVFGDDILYPSIYHDGVVQGLTTAGLVPNVGKTFHRGFFRESCGVDAYNGEDVTPLRVKKCDITLLEGAESLLDLAKRLRQRGFSSCSAFIYSELSSHYGRLPLCNNPDATGFVEYVDIDWVSLMCREPRLKYKRGIQTWGVPCRMVKSVLMDSYTHGWYHVQDSLLRLARMGQKDSDRGVEYPVPYRERFAYGWAQCLMK